MKYWRGRKISSFTKEELEDEINYIYTLAEEKKYKEISRLSGAYKKKRDWHTFNKISVLAATNIEDYLRDDKDYFKLKELQKRYKEML